MGADAPGATKWNLTQQSQALWAAVRSQGATRPMLLGAVGQARAVLGQVSALPAWGEAGILEAQWYGPWESTTGIKQRLREVIRVGEDRAAGRQSQQRAAPTGRVNVWEEAGRNTPGAVRERVEDVSRSVRDAVSSPWTKVAFGLAALGAIGLGVAAMRGRR